MRLYQSQCPSRPTLELPDLFALQKPCPRHDSESAHPWSTRRPLSSSFLGLPYRILKINHKKELLRSLWVGLTTALSGVRAVGCVPRAPFAPCLAGPEGTWKFVGLIFWHDHAVSSRV